MKPHKYADLIHAWADGVQIQVKYDDWVDTSNPQWNENFQYRIKPEPKPDIVRYHEVFHRVTESLQSPYHNVKVTFDGETGQLKSVEVIK